MNPTCAFSSLIHKTPKSAKIKLRISGKGMFLIDFSIAGNIFGFDHQNVPLIIVVVKLN